MPRHAPAPPSTPVPDTAAQPTSIIASAANVSRGNLRPKSAGALDWQTEAWSFYDTVGELRFACTWTGQALSRVRLYVARDTGDGSEEVTEGVPAEALDLLFNGEQGQSQMMQTLGIHLSVPGESYLVGEPSNGAEHGKPDEWMILSTAEISGTRQGVWTVDRGEGKRRLSPDAMIIRIWRPHPRAWVEADSAVRAVLPILRELLQLTKHVAATIDSRLAGAGILLLPSEMTFQSPPGTDPLADPLSDPFMRALTQAMLTAVEDRGDASALVPIVVKAPGAVLGDARLLTFDSPLTSEAQNLRDEAIRRLALGMDLPPEIMLGQADSNHWSAWQIEESALKVVIDPLCELICSALTEQWLWPVLKGQGVADYFAYSVGSDTSDLRLRPDHSNEAIQLYDRLELSGEALRRETGFDETDAPTDTELQDILAKKLAATGDPAAAAKLGVDTAPAPAPVVVRNLGGLPPAQTPETTPSIEQRPVPEQQVASLLAVGEVIALRALERAHNRMGRRTPPRPVPEEAMESALRGAWDNVPHCADLLGVNHHAFTARLDAYVRDRLRTGAEHDTDALRLAILRG